MDESFRILLDKISQYKKNHIKSIDKNMLHWFQSCGLSVIKDFCAIDEAIELNYKIIESGVSVEITSDSLLLCKFDIEMVQVLKAATAIFIEANKNGTFTITLWFKGWKWEEIEMSDSF